MKRMFLSATGFLALLVCMTAPGSQAAAQTRDKYLISAKAGGINFVTGNVTVIRQGTKSQQAVTDQDNLESGDVVTTGAGGRVEVLLNPGSYLRVAENSEFELADASLENLRIRLLRGSAIIEVVGTDDTQLSLKVETPQTVALLVRRGIYRLNVLQTGATEVLVRKGRALVGIPPLEVKSGKMIVVGRGFVAEVVKIDKRDKDSLELWSHDRAEYLASINRRISPTAQLIDYSMESIFPSTGYRDRHRGAWAYDSQRGCYVFLPGRGGASSPYGYGYRNRGNCCVNGRGNETPPRVPSPGSTPTAGVNPTPPSAPSSPGDQPGESGGNYRPSEPTSRPTESPSPVGRPDYSPAPTVSSPPAPAYSPPPSSPPAAPAGAAAPQMRESPND
jgi:hypothetical protein